MSSGRRFKVKQSSAPSRASGKHPIDIEMTTKTIKHLAKMLEKTRI
jgi:hypothetical protein